MIDYIYGGEYLAVTSNKGATPYINSYQNQPMVGAMTYDNSSQTMKVYDGSNWQAIGGGTANINLTGNAIAVLKWAEKKMHEETERNKLAETNATIRDLVEQIKQKEEQIKIVQTLIKEEEKIGTS
jgi:hypothetical protein